MRVKPLSPPHTLGEAMRELLRSTDSVLISFVVSTLAGEGIDAVVLDMHTSILEGSIAAIPRRVMVREEDNMRARRIFMELGSIVLSPDRPAWP
jgi:Putative prokaryotic signal transducing protein